MNKVCIIATVPITLQAFVLETAKYLYENGGFDITFVCDHDIHFRDLCPSYIHYLPVSMKRGIDISGIFAIRRMKRIFQRECFDMIWYCTPNASFYAAIAAKSANCPVRLYAQLGVLYMKFSGLKRGIFKLLEQITCRKSTVIEPVSFGIRAFSIAEGLYAPEKARVIHNGSPEGLDPVRFDLSRKPEWRQNVREQLNIPQSAKVIGYLGRICADKGILELLESAKRLIDLNDQVYLLIIGKAEPDFHPGPIWEKWMTSCPNVRVMAWTDRPEQYYATMDLFLFPSYREGLGMVCIEAQAMAVPVIISDIPGLSEAMVPEESGLKVPVRNAEALYEAADQLLFNEEKLRRMGAYGHSYVMERYNREELFRQVLLDRTQLMKAGDGQ